MKAISRAIQVAGKGLSLARDRAYSRDVRSLFDADWYVQQYKDIEHYKDGPLNHFMRSGATERREPNAYFDSKFYIARAANIRQSVENVLTHYLTCGLTLGLSPSPYFDPVWYLRQNEDVRRSGMDPFVHFVNHGSHEGRSPNPFFDAKWYLEQYEKSEAIAEPPLLHYIRAGVGKALSPSKRFDPIFYINLYSDVKEAGTPPLQHYLTHGLEEGRRPLYDPIRSLIPASSSNIECIKRPLLGDEVALFVTHAPDGTIKPHVQFHIEALVQSSIDVVLIVNSNQATVKIDDLLLNGISGLYIRDNQGFDFGAWAHVWQILPEARRAEMVYLINDSIIGPLSLSLLKSALSRIRASKADVIGMVDSYEVRKHLQSFFIALKRDAIASAAVQDFFSETRSLPDKQMVIDEYETRFSHLMSSAGLRCEALFPAAEPTPINRTIYKWRELIEAGFPYIKVTTVRDEFPGVSTAGWNMTAPGTEYDLRLVGGLMAPKRDIPFDAHFYLAAYPDVARAGWQALEHYDKHGRQEGRQTCIPGLSSMRDLPRPRTPRRCALVVSHDGNKGGAPVLVYNIAKALSHEMDVIVLFLGDGEVLNACKAIGVQTVGPAHLRDSHGLADYTINEIVLAARPDFAIVNSVESRFVLPFLAARSIPAITLVHEFAAYIRPESAFLDAVIWSGETVFSTVLTRDNALSYHPELAVGESAIFPQGLCETPPGQSPRSRDAECRRSARTVRPATFEGVVVLGCGYVEYRKGVDLFISCAGDFINRNPKISVRFVWVGKGFKPSEHASYSSFLVDQIERLGLKKFVFFMEEVEDLMTVYRSADIFLLPSRLDPMPNVAIGALSAGLPVLCFDKASGIAVKLREDGLSKDCVADYLDVGSLAQKLSRMVTDTKLRARVGQHAIRLAKDNFDMASYVRQLLDIADRAAAQMGRELLDVETILSAEIVDYRYHRSMSSYLSDPDLLVRRYVRSWAKKTSCRKLFPGFHPGIYRDEAMGTSCQEDPLAHYIRSGAPDGAWNNRVIKPPIGGFDAVVPVSCALHIHCFYTDIFGDIIRRIVRNRRRPDLLISFPEGIDKDSVLSLIPRDYAGRVISKSVPNIGRDIGPFLVAFREEIQEYDVVGHVHTKSTADVEDRSQILSWREFLYENMLGGTHQMIDVVLRDFSCHSDLGIVFPDDPHSIGWDKNRGFAAQLWARITTKPLPDSFRFPIGSVFWARSDALSALWKLNLNWSDFPEEPLPYDGSVLHALERLFGMVVEERGYKVATTQCDGISRPL